MSESVDLQLFPDRLRNILRLWFYHVVFFVNRVILWLAIWRGIHVAFLP